MARTPKMIICRNCNNPIYKTAKVCPYCGARNRKPFYKKGWFILVVIIAVVGAFGSIGGDGDSVDVPVQEENYETQVDTKVEENVVATEGNKSEEITTVEEITTAEGTVESSAEDGMAPDFKAAMDSYEAFMDEYVAFMNKYSENPGDMSLLADYAGFMEDYAAFTEDFEKWEETDLNNEELQYYLEVQSRVTQKLMEVAGY